jgi:hypothetical protein
MAELTLPVALDKDYWIKTATKDFEKTANLTKLLEKVEEEHAALKKALDKLTIEVDPDDPNPTKAAEARAKEVEGNELKKLDQVLAGALKQLEAAADKLLPAAKKAGKESAVKGLTTAIKVYRTNVTGVADDVRTQLKNLIAGKKDSGKPVDKKAAALLDKQILRYSLMVKKAVRELKSGKVRSMPFVFGAHKQPEPYKKGKEWPAKSLLHMHPKAGQGSRNMLTRLVGTTPKFFIGEARCEDRKKIIFDFTQSAVAPPKLLKDSLLFHCGYAPAFKAMKAGKVEGDERGEGEDSGEPIGDIPDDDDDLLASDVAPTPRAGTAKTTGGAGEDEGAPTEAEDEGKKAAKFAEVKAERAKLSKRFTALSDAIKAALRNTVDADKAQQVRKLAVEVGELVAPGGDLEAAPTKLKELEDLLSGKSTVAAKTTGGAPPPSPELEAAVRELATLRARAVTGITRVAELIRRSYQGDPQAAKAADGATKVDGSKRLLTPAVETQITALLNTNDSTRRAALAGAARTSVANYRKSLAAHELLPDIDKSVFDPNLSVIEPYLKSLERAESLLGNIRA